MKPSAVLTGFCVLLTITAASAAQQPQMVDVWPGKAPGETGPVDAEKVLEAKAGENPPVRRITNVTRPTLSIFRPASDKDTHAAVIVCPGGGYNILAWDHEGEQVAAWLNSIGVTGIVLKYRVPRREGTPSGTPPPQALMDAQRAVSLVRSRASEWGLDPQRIGMLGFSAGGHITAWTSTNFDKRSYAPIDDVDRISSRPDFAVMIYPGGVVAKDTDDLSPEIRVTKETPTSFFAHAGDDRVRPQNSIIMYLALKKAGVPSELHIYASGGHGFGMRSIPHPAATWPQRCADWLQSQGLLRPKS
jgi:acetyl esterase/lipase